MEAIHFQQTEMREISLGGFNTGSPILWDEESKFTNELEGWEGRPFKDQLEHRRLA